MSLNDRHARPARRRRRHRPRVRVVVALAVAATVLGTAFAHQLLDATPPPPAAAPSTSASVSASSSAGQAGSSAPATEDDAGAPSGAPGAEVGGRRLPRGETGETGSDSVTAFDDVVTVTNLDPALRAALQQATTDATEAGIQIVVSSGWRSAELQQQLLDEAVAQYGSRQEAEKWVATPQTSAHVAGDAVDLGPAAAATWLSKHGATYGLCQIYANEAWHYELRPEATASGCPTMYADPTQDPRMHQ